MTRAASITNTENTVQAVALVDLEACAEDRARHAEQVLLRLEGLPTLSPIATRLLSIGASDDADMDEVVRLIESDPALTARILGLTRKASTGLGDRIQTVKHATMMVGLGAIRTAVLGVEVFDLLNAQADAAQAKRAGDPGGVHFDRAGFWRSSLAVGCAAELIAKNRRLPGVAPDEAFVAGLLHGAGKLALEIAMPRSYRKALALASSSCCDLASAERAVLGIDHHRAGKRIAERWGLPEALRDVMWLYGQEPKAVPAVADRDLVLLVTLSSRTVREIHLGWTGDGDLPPETRALRHELAIEGDVGAMLAPGLHATVADRCTSLGLDDASSTELLTESLMKANRSLSRIAREAQAQVQQAARRVWVLDAVERFICPPAQITSPGLLAESSTEHADRFGGVATEIERVAESFRDSVGRGFLGAVIKSGGVYGWLGVVFDEQGLVSETVELGSVEDLPSVWGLAGILGTLSNGSDGPSRVPAWLEDLATRGGVEPTALRGTVLHDPHASSGGYRAMLVHELSPESAPLGAPGYASLAKAWTWWLRAADRAEHAERVGDRLADANRELASTQAKLSEARTMAHLGEITAGAAHEMNNPLTVILARSQQMVKQAVGKGEKQNATAITEAGFKLADLIVSLHLLAEKPEPNKAKAGPGEVISKAIGMLTGKLEAGTLRRIQPRVDPAPETELDVVMLARALAELVRNGLESGDGAVVEVSMLPDALGERLIYVVRDTGRGISAHALEHAFDPFFSERGAGRGAGLGLCRAKCLAEAHGGSVRLARLSAGGTAAFLGVPLAQDPSAVQVEDDDPYAADPEPPARRQSVA